MADTEINKLREEFNQIVVENERLRSKILELEIKLSTGFNNFNGQLTNINNRVTPVYNHYQNNVNGQIELLKMFLRLHCRTALGSRISAKELNEKVYAFSLKKGIPIMKTEVSGAEELVTAPPFKLDWYKSTGGIACYRDLEFIPIDLSEATIQKSNLPQIQNTVNSPRSPISGATSPAPVMMNRQ